MKAFLIAALISVLPYGPVQASETEPAPTVRGIAELAASIESLTVDAQNLRGGAAWTTEVRSKPALMLIARRYVGDLRAIVARHRLWSNGVIGKDWVSTVWSDYRKDQALQEDTSTKDALLQRNILIDFAGNSGVEKFELTLEPATPSIAQNVYEGATKKRSGGWNDEIRDWRQLELLLDKYTSVLKSSVSREQISMEQQAFKKSWARMLLSRPIQASGANRDMLMSARQLRAKLVDFGGEEPVLQLESSLTFSKPLNES